MNKVVIIGRVSKDIDLKFLPGDGKAIAKFTVFHKGVDFIRKLIKGSLVNNGFK